jgi:hypothetical protein
MPTATAPKPTTAPEPTQNALADYVMPKPSRGQMVVFHANGIPSAVTDVMAYVLSVSPSNVELNVNGLVQESVPHHSDPRLQTKPHMKEHGSWDFTARDKEFEARLAAVESKLASLLS